jgi:hypothetical protein
MTKPSKNPRRPTGRRPELQRLVDLTVLGPTHPELGTCWLFTGVTTPYGRIAKAQDSYNHRLGWKLLRGPIPEGKELHHRCGIYACWNPDHLELVTHAENQRHLRKTQCSQGHPMSGSQQTNIRSRTVAWGSRPSRVAVVSRGPNRLPALPAIPHRIHYVNRNPANRSIAHPSTDHPICCPFSLKLALSH